MKEKEEYIASEHVESSWRYCIDCGGYYNIDSDEEELCPVADGYERWAEVVLLKP